jgi:molecular chaperone GrpE
MADPRRNRKSFQKGRRGGNPCRLLQEEDAARNLPFPEGAVEETSTEQKEPDCKDDLLERYQRLAAEFDNYRKRQARDFNRLIEQGRKKLVEELLTILDNFDRARLICQGDHSDKEVVDGIMQTSDQLKNILRKEGLEEIPTELGIPFDPHIHEAMFAENIESGDCDVILEVYQKGYRFGQELIRPARVKVGKVSSVDGG